MLIGYFGDGPWAHKALDLICETDDIKISFICGRFEKNDLILKKKAKEIGVDFILEKNINSNKVYEKLIQYNCDLFVSMSFNQIFKKSIFNIPKFGTINCHAGKLPLYRGRNVLNWVLINDEKEFGITVHYVDDGIDTGDIIIQETFQINEDDNYQTLLQKAYEECPKILLKSLFKIKKFEVKATPQINKGESFMYCSKRVEGDEIINWDSDSREIFNFIRALTSPGPGAISYNKTEPIQILKSELVKDSPIYKGIPGCILEINQNSFLVKTKDSYIRILKWECKLPIYIGLRLKKEF